MFKQLIILLRNIEELKNNKKKMNNLNKITILYQNYKIFKMTMAKLEVKKNMMKICNHKIKKIHAFLIFLKISVMIILMILRLIIILEFQILKNKKKLLIFDIYSFFFFFFFIILMCII